MRRLFGTRYSDVRLLGAMVTSRRAWPLVGVALHVANGAAFGAAFARLGGHGIARGVLAAEAENLALWPWMALVDRYHPDRRSGAWPPLLGNRRVFAQEVAVHALFGTVLGALTQANGLCKRDGDQVTSGGLRAILRSPIVPRTSIGAAGSGT